MISELISDDPRVQIGYGTCANGTPLIRPHHANNQIIIGKFCSFAHEVTIFSGGNHPMNFVTTYPSNYFLASTNLLTGVLTVVMGQKPLALVMMFGLGTVLVFFREPISVMVRLSVHTPLSEVLYRLTRSWLETPHRSCDIGLIQRPLLNYWISNGRIGRRIRSKNSLKILLRPMFQSFWRSIPDRL